MIVVIGVLLCLAGVMLLANLLGAGDYVIRRVTSRYLGSLPPGYAASKRGFRVYAILVLAIGVVFLGVGVTASTVLPGIVLLAVGIAAFIATSVIAIRGEVATARGPKT